MDGHATDHVEILQDHNALFRSLAFYEEDLERRCKMHKRRVDMLEPICNDLNAQYYLMIRRQMMFELAEIYNEMMDLKLTLANRQADSETLDNHTIKKFNHLCSALQGTALVFLCSYIHSFNRFLKSGVLLSRYFQMFLDSKKIQRKQS
uniref:KIF-binding protein-like n=1 Tax=Gasterosteus aculeatus aculeatus TaxID=481459 RepID=UPI001A9997B2|nr:KIF-binding protein-like [Gasterosteus aculeatus aculeatus]